MPLKVFDSMKTKLSFEFLSKFTVSMKFIKKAFSNQYSRETFRDIRIPYFTWSNETKHKHCLVVVFFICFYSIFCLQRDTIKWCLISKFYLLFNKLIIYLHNPLCMYVCMCTVLCNFVCLFIFDSSKLYVISFSKKMSVNWWQNYAILPFYSLFYFSHTHHFFILPEGQCVHDHNGFIILFYLISFIHANRIKYAIYKYIFNFSVQ